MLVKIYTFYVSLKMYKLPEQQTRDLIAYTIC